MNRSIKLVQTVLITTFCLVIYATTLKNGFVYDDADTIIDNTFIKDFSNLPKLVSKSYFQLSEELSYRPVVTLTYFVDYRLYSLNAWGYHLTNVLLHAVNGLLLYNFLTFKATKGIVTEKAVRKKNTFLFPLIITLLFLSHPVLTEAVNCISFREDLLVFLFYMITLRIYLALRTSNVPQIKSVLVYLISCITYFLALLSKEMAATLPLIVFCYEWIYAENKEDRLQQLFNRYNFGYIAITALYLYLRFYYFYNLSEANVSSWPPNERLLTVPYLILNNLKLMAFPLSLSAEYKLDPVNLIISFLGYLVPTLFILGLAYVLKKNRKSIAFGIFFFVLTLLPTYNLIPIANPLAERYLYLPAVGFVIAFGTTIMSLYEKEEVKNKKSYILIICFAILSIYSFAVIRRNEVWKDDHSLWADAVRKMPKSPKAHYNLGNAYKEKQHWDLALYQWKEAVRIYPKYSEAHNQIGNVYLMRGEDALAIEEYKEALKTDPNNAETYYNIALILEKQGNYEEALRNYKHFVNIASKWLEPTVIQVKEHIKELEADGS